MLATSSTLARRPISEVGRSAMRCFSISYRHALLLGDLGEEIHHTPSHRPRDQQCGSANALGSALMMA
jgi:hypothetical protein